MHNNPQNSEDLHQPLQRIFKLSQFRGDQEAVIRSALDQQSSLVLMPTGTGKSLCYQMPAAVGKGLVLVISPLIALMQDQVSKARAMGLRAAALHSSMSRQDRDERLERLKEGHWQLLYVTPERFRKPDFLAAIKSQALQLLAVDEAHCISAWGHDFRPDYSRLGEFRALLGNPPTMALTATATKQVQKDILLQLQIPEATVFAGGLERPNLALNFHEVYGIDEKIRTMVALRFQNPGSAIIYFSLIQTLLKVSHELRRLGQPHMVYHGDLPSEERHGQQKKFQDSADGLMLATPAFGLGVDKADIRLLIHSEISNSVESYYQEVGRAGRDGLPAQGHLLLDNDDVSIQMEFIKWANPEPAFIRRVFELIKDNPLRVEQEGMNFLREQMNFYNKRDYRVETAVNQLERLGMLQESSSRFGYIPNPNFKFSDRTEAETSFDFMDRDQVESRVRNQHSKLLEMVRLASMKEGCRMQFVLEYFGHATKVCGICDLCQAQE